MRTLLSIGIATALAVGLASSAVSAPKRGLEASQSQPFTCRTDEGYGRYTTCDHSH